MVNPTQEMLKLLTYVKKFFVVTAELAARNSVQKETLVICDRNRKITGMQFTSFQRDIHILRDCDLL